MRDYKKEHYVDVCDDRTEYIVTHNLCLAATLGSLGYRVFIKKRKIISHFIVF